MASFFQGIYDWLLRLFWYVVCSFSPFSLVAKRPANKWPSPNDDHVDIVPSISMTETDFVIHAGRPRWMSP